MLWMGIWVHPYAFNTSCKWGWILGKIGYGQACMMLADHGWGCKPPLTASHIHIGCIQSVLAPGDAVDGHMGASLCVQVGVSFRKNGVWPSLYDVVVSLLRLQTPIDCIPHPYWMYKKCFSSTLRCCGWAYGCTHAVPIRPYVDRDGSHIHDWVCTLA